MRLKKVFAGALAAAMLVCAVAVPAFAAEEVEQENCLTSRDVYKRQDLGSSGKVSGIDYAHCHTLRDVVQRHRQNHHGGSVQLHGSGAHRAAAGH